MSKPKRVYKIIFFITRNFIINEILFFKNDQITLFTKLIIYLFFEKKLF